MKDGRPSLRLTGGTVLMRGKLAQEPVSIDGDRIAADGTQEIDVTGHMVLPGIVDLRSSAWRVLVDGHGADAIAPALKTSARELARHGITTAWLSVGWMRGDLPARPDVAETAAVALPAIAQDTGLSLKLRIEADTHLTELGDRLARLVSSGAVAHLGMLPLFSLLTDAHVSVPGAQAAWSGLRSTAPSHRDAIRRESAARAANMPRHVCQLAAACDGADIGFSSLYDRDAEAREYFRMLGARFADAPLSRAAASSAIAMGDPVLIEARDAIGATRHQAWIGEGLVGALVSGDTPSAPLRAALALEAAGLMPLEASWTLVSSAPAAFGGYADRGDIRPGKRADLILLDRETGHVAATLSGGRLVAGQGPLAEKLAEHADLAMAAE